MAGHGGEWKVAYADFVTAMMAFFLVMWITAQSASVKEAVSQYFRDPFPILWKSTGEGAPISTNAPGPAERQGSPGHEGTGAPPRQRNSQDKKKGGLGKEPYRQRGRFAKAAGVPIDDPTATPGKLLIPGRGTLASAGNVIYFEPASAELSEEQKSRLKLIAQEIAGKPQKIELLGHTSHRPLPPHSPYRDHWDLAFARSRRVMGLMVDLGIDPARIRIGAAGDTETAQAGDPQTAEKINSRVDVYLIDVLVTDFAEPVAQSGRGHRPPSASAIQP